MRLLLDTHVLLWLLNEPERLNPSFVGEVEDPANQVLFSAASIWEIAIKTRLGRPDFKADPGEILRALLNAQFIEAPIDAETTIRVADLPLHHRDPFDRLLVAQAMALPVRLFTADRRLAAYSDLVTVI